MKSFLLFISLFLSGYGFAQPQIFPQLGQLPTNAFPVCGLDTFRQLISPYASGGFINIAGCGRIEILDPYYYSFTCYDSGRLAILIEPLYPPQDLNWELFDITGHNPNDIYTNTSLQVIGNWSGKPGRTGAALNGMPYTKCLSDAALMDSTFSSMPHLVQGHQYLLLVSDYSKRPNDYFVSFTGSTAVITNPLPRQLQSAYVGCNKKSIHVVMNRKMRCNSINADGSEFSINSPSAQIKGASGINCNDQFDFDTLELTLNDTLAPGNYTLAVKNGGNGNILWDDCLRPISSGEQISFTVAPSAVVSAEFSYQIGYGCTADTIHITSQFAQNGFNSFWYTDSVFTSSLPEPEIITSDFRTFQIRHIASGGSCSDTVTKTVNLDNYLKADFQSPTIICPGDLITFSDRSTGNIVSWIWNFGDGTTGNQQQPPAHFYPDGLAEKKYPVTLIVKNDLGCFDTASTWLTKLRSCVIAVPNAFTPNGDGKNDFLYPLNTFSAKDFSFKVYNRFGQLVFESHDPAHKWDGRINDTLQPTGLYIWTFSYTDGTSGKNISLHGTSLLLR